MREIALSILILGEILQVSLELIHPGKIAANKEVVQEGETVTLKCLLTAYHRRQHEQYRVYLLQNGRQVQHDMGSSSLGGANFKIEQVTLEKAGRYECVYSQESVELLQGAAGSNSVNLEVKELHSFLTLKEEKHKTPRGLDAIFKCIIPHEKREIILTKPDGGYFELYRDKVLLSRQQMQSIPAVNFYFKNITQTFVGSYECVYRTDSNFTRRSRPVFFTYAEAENVTESNTSGETSSESYLLGNVIRLVFTGLALILMLCFVVEAFINGLK
ncbi:uncharacterized protein LOC120536190 isoform X1 [Polypterus senegalus]|uniref:uncharacterized protein LOC120536190 isoform X1 n=1 Tax=Polypterus senegalus TaxID=55291 RepID=UPI0019624F30|nr:uncharacterized protein LOC120536190 isoform X1 [Polypterus senegalus]